MFRFTEAQLRSMNKGCTCGMYERIPRVNLAIKIIDFIEYSPDTGEIGGVFNAEKGRVDAISCSHCGKSLWKRRGGKNNVSTY